MTDRTQGNAMEGFISLAPKMIRSSIGRWYFPKSPARIAIGPGAKGRTFESCGCTIVFNYALKVAMQSAPHSHSHSTVIKVRRS